MHARETMHCKPCYKLRLWRHGVAWDCDVIADVNKGWGECILPTGNDISTWNIRFDSSLMLSYFLNYFTLYVIQGIANGCPCIVEIGGIYSCALATSLYSPTARTGSPTKAQHCVPRISTLHRHSPDSSKLHGANKGPTWVLSASHGPHVGPMNLAIRVILNPFNINAETKWPPLCRCHF